MDSPLLFMLVFTLAWEAVSLTFALFAAEPYRTAGRIAIVVGMAFFAAWLLLVLLVLS